MSDVRNLAVVVGRGQAVAQTRGVIPLGFEPKTHALEERCSIQLSYGTSQSGLTSSIPLTLGRLKAVAFVCARLIGEFAGAKIGDFLCSAKRLGKKYFLRICLCHLATWRHSRRGS